MENNKVIIEQKHGFTIHGEVGPGGRIGNFTVTPDYLNATYHLVRDAQHHVYEQVKKREKMERELHEAQMEELFGRLQKRSA